MDIICAKHALLVETNKTFVELLMRLVILQKTEMENRMLCHPCSQMLLSRAAKELQLAVRNNQIEVAESKIISILLIINEGILQVFSENLYLKNDQIGCSTSDFKRFQGCCIENL